MHAITNDLAELTELNDAYIQSVQRGDVRRFSEILADDFLCSRPDGSIIDRAQFLEATAQPVTIANLAAHDVNIRILDDVAIIHARTTFTTADGRLASGAIPTSGRSAAVAGSPSPPTSPGIERCGDGATA